MGPKFMDTAQLYMLLLGGDVKERMILPIAGFVLIIAICLKQWNKNAHHAPSFRNADGKPIKEYPKDTRFMRFTQGKELSEAGQAMAGDDPYLIRNGRFQELVIFSPEHLQQFHRKDAKDHFKPDNMNMGDYAGQLLGQCVGQMSGQRWKRTRAHFDPEFSHQSSGKMLPVFAEQINQWADGLCKSPTRPVVENGVFIQDIVAACKALSLKSIAMSIYGNAFDESKYGTLVTLNQLHEKIMFVSFLGSRTISSWYNILPTPEKSLMNNFQKQWKAFNLSVIEISRQEHISCPAERIYNGVEEGDLTLQEYLQTLDEMLFTNIDITGSILALILKNLAKDREFQKKLRGEIAQQKSSPSYGVADYIAKQNTFLHYVIMESIRVTPSMYFSLPECNSSSKTIAGYTIPPHTPTLIDIQRLNLNEKIWGSDAAIFRPERFVGLDPAQYRFWFVRWGIGRDKCMGKNMADVILKLTILSMLDKYVLQEAPPREAGDKRTISRDGFTVGQDGEVELRRIPRT